MGAPQDQGKGLSGGVVGTLCLGVDTALVNPKGGGQARAEGLMGSGPLHSHRIYHRGY